MKHPKKPLCELCGHAPAVEQYQGKSLCRRCLCPPAEPVPVPWLRTSTLVNDPAVCPVRGW
jgi:hypothetical protein